MSKFPCETEILIDCEDILNKIVPCINFLSGVMCDREEITLGFSAISGLSWILKDIASQLEQVSKSLNHYRT